MKSFRIPAMFCWMLFLVGCDKAPVPEKLPDDPKHVWSDQTEAYYQAKEVSRFAEEQQFLNEKRIEELGVIPDRSRQ